ncbi:PspC domain-containing protein [Anaerocolumna chitinilytica]|uniref:PspC family transcriptional regulator n=1 Tax=Anaerocolumna chitinilytica TaxID=1727145 RepID=A0A7I8DLZ1_9FIRM|nr:PspC domain-containing protein [Anaerocolumna chitinilytica]BCJ99428.1 PspC family transcriptional regulator [Anaerocolumna chitinilytica]
MENKRLYRSRKNRMIAGVCGGFAEYLNIDPTIVRLVIVLLAIFGVSAGFWIYLIAAIIVPNEE